MSARVPVVTVAGWLGTGKTTAVTDLVSRLPGRSAVVVNDFGEARIDATILASGASVTDIAGGCLCCTAPEGLAATIEDLLDAVRPDRIFIEPSGLARPQDILDTLSRGGLAARVARGPTLVLVDPSRLADPPEGLREQLDAADVLVANRCDLADDSAVAAFRALAAGLWPGPARVVETRFGVLPTDVVDWPAGHGPRAPERDAPRQGGHDHAGHDHAAHDHDARAHAHARYLARSSVFAPDVLFRFDALRAGLEAPALERVKGLFQTDAGWMRIDRAGGRLHVAATSYRRDSRFDAIAATDAALDALVVALEAARVEEADASVDRLALVDARGIALALDRAALAALPGQVPDVGVVVPGRAGAGVRLREVLALVAPPPDAVFVVRASDGMTTAPVAVPDAGEAVLVHSLDGGPLPEGQGGPFRLLVPPSEGGEKPRCANVKSVVRVRIVGA
jgi:G3E family GTPase